MKIAIIGGGIGGLTTAIALQQKGFTDITVYEAAPEIKAVGAGLWIAANAIIVFDRLGIADQVKAAGNILQSAGLGNHKGEILSKIDFTKIIQRYGNGTVAIHRGKLQQILMKNADKSTILTHKRLKNIKITEGSKTELYFEDGTSAEADLVIGADGIHSVVRKRLFGETPLRYSGQTCWRGITQMSLENPKNSAELWGTQAGLRACVSQVSDTEVYWYITQKHKAGLKLSETETKPYLLNLISEFNSPIQKVVQLTDNQHILHNDLFDFAPLKEWYKGNTILIGDAAHATTPNLGQGACQAIEDAWHLADCLKSTPSPTESMTVSEAFARFYNLRKEKTAFVTKTSLQIGQLSNLGGAIGYRLRNWLLSVTPSSMAEKQFDYLFHV
ncbi:MAG: FAD-dependent monooxygenase [Saprospiraceae bacterium]|nr:FAD-dependent monooxygenase [Saprospiraceae bacterium]